MKSFTSKIYSYMIVVLIFVLGFILLKSFNQFNYIIPNFKTLSKNFINIITTINTYQIVLITILKTTVIILISVVLSIITSLLSYIFKIAEDSINIVVSLLKVLPIITIILLLTIIFFNPEIRFIGTMIVSFIAVFPLMHENLLHSLKQIDKEIIDETKLVANKKNILKVIYYVYLPLIKINIYNTILQCFGLTLKVLVMSEVLFSVKGSFGEKISLASQYMQIEDLYIWTFILVLIVISVDMLLRKIKKLV